MDFTRRPGAGIRHKGRKLIPSAAMTITMEENQRCFDDGPYIYGDINDGNGNQFMTSPKIPWGSAYWCLVGNGGMNHNMQPSTIIPFPHSLLRTSKLVSRPKGFMVILIHGTLGVDGG